MWIPGLLIFTLVFVALHESSRGKEASSNSHDEWSLTRHGLRLRRGFKWNKTVTTTTQRPVWQPKVNGRLALAKQKNINPDNIPADDEEFKNVWPDDYYDDYDFEHKRNMIQHGTFEGRIQKYHEQELAEAKAEMSGDPHPPKPADDGM